MPKTEHDVFTENMAGISTMKGPFLEHIPVPLLSYNEFSIVFSPQSLCVTIKFLEVVNKIKEQYNHG